MSRQQLKNDIVHRLLRKRVIGGKKRQKQTVANWFRSSDQGTVKDLIDEMSKNREAPVRKYGGGHRENVHLISAEAAVKYLDDNGGDIPFGFGDINDDDDDED